ncbi:hypothetical protein DPMN_035129 [Dreissena polymorpha]|uniref:Uncharacterized protein n=1 Tax=Dreissena polymorpha TaxID=45954 RepID=A0A9D4M9Z4_DREPO|nr:hypothetical protein DPMN_035129 [Dreissena polymorpha]
MRPHVHIEGAPRTEGTAGKLNKVRVVIQRVWEEAVTVGTETQILTQRGTVGGGYHGYNRYSEQRQGTYPDSEGKGGQMGYQNINIHPVVDMVPIRDFLARFRQHVLKLMAEKRVLFQLQVDFLGRWVSSKEIAMVTQGWSIDRWSKDVK